MGDGEVAAEVSEATEAVATEDTGGDPLLDALSAFNPDEASQVAEAEGEAKTEPEATKEEKKDPEKSDGKPKKKSRLEFEAFLMSDAELAKPDGLKKAAGYWQKQQSRIDGIEIRQKQNAEKLESDRTAAQQWFASEHQKLERDRATARELVALSKRLQDPENLSDVLDAIGEITGRKGAGREIWEKLARFAIKGGKKDESSALVSSLEAKVAALEARLEKQPEEQKQAAEAEKAAAEAKQIEAARAAIITQLTTDAAKYPLLAEKLVFTKMHPAITEEVRLQRKAAREAGQPIDIPTAFARIESALQKRRQPSQGEPGSPRPSDSGSPVAATVTSIAPSQARTAAISREKTQAERERELAADQGFIAAVFGQ